MCLRGGRGSNFRHIWCIRTYVLRSEQILNEVCFLCENGLSSLLHCLFIFLNFFHCLINPYLSFINRNSFLCLCKICSVFSTNFLSIGLAGSDLSKKRRKPNQFRILYVFSCFSRYLWAPLMVHTIKRPLTSKNHITLQFIAACL